MQARTIKLLVLMLFMGGSTVAFAGGEGCNSKKGGHKELSAEALQDMEKGHTWHKFSESDQAGKAKQPEKQVTDKNAGLIES